MEALRPRWVLEVQRTKEKEDENITGADIPRSIGQHRPQDRFLAGRICGCRSAPRDRRRKLVRVSDARQDCSVALDVKPDEDFVVPGLRREIDLLRPRIFAARKLEAVRPLQNVGNIQSI